MAWNSDPDLWNNTWHVLWKETCPEGRKHVQHVEEIAAACRIFDERQKAGMNIFEAAENLPIPQMNMIRKLNREVQRGCANYYRHSRRTICKMFCRESVRTT
jgi:hypothetical protein